MVLPHLRLRLRRLSALALGALGAAGVFAATAPSAQAHPHVWIEAGLHVDFDARGRATAITASWYFDEMYSQVVVLGMDTDGDGVYSDEELQPLVDEAMVNLNTWNYFTELRHGDEKITPRKAESFTATMDDMGRLVYRFTLPIDPVRVTERKPLVVRSFDPSFFIDITMLEDEPVSMAAAAPNCAVDIEQPPPLEDNFLLSEAALMTMSFAPGTEGIGGRMAEKVSVTCAAS